MDADPINRIEPGARKWSMAPDDMPHPVRVRYLKDHRGGPGLGYYVDATARTAVFRDMGDRLSTERNDPNVVRDLVAIAEHRGWAILHVRGQTAFRREVWLTARAAGLEVRGYRPTERDLQQATRRQDARTDPPPPSAETRLRVVETVVRNRVVEPSEQARILAAARARLARWLERASPVAQRDRERPAGR